MDSLRPDREEVDNFQRSRNSGKANKKPNKAVTGKPRHVAAPKPRSSSNGLLWLTMVVVIAAGGAFGWFYNQQRLQLSAMNAELNDAMGFVRQSKLLMARFEGQLSETGADLEVTGSETQKKLKFLESEVRKLWGIAYDRNRKAIAANDGGIKQFGSELKTLALANRKLSSSLTGIEKSIVQQNKSAQTLEQTLQKLQKEWPVIKVSGDRLAAQIKQVEEASGTAVAALQKEIKSLKAEAGGNKRIQQHQLAIEAIDASRIQLNSRIVSLEKRVNDLQLSLKSSKSP